MCSISCPMAECVSKQPAAGSRDFCSELTENSADPCSHSRADLELVMAGGIGVQVWLWAVVSASGVAGMRE